MVFKLMDTKLPFSILHVTINLFKILAISGLVLYLAKIIFFTQSNCPSSDFFSPLQHIFTPNSQTTLPPPPTSTTTNVSHLIFGLVGTLKSWWHRRAYIKSWWRSNATLGYLFLDTAPTEELLPWSTVPEAYKMSPEIEHVYLKKINLESTRVS